MRTTGWPAFSSAATCASCSCIGRGFQAQVGEHAVVAVDLRRAEWLAIHRDDALALLAGGFGDQLLEPRAEIVNPGRSDDRDLVAASFRGRAQNRCPASRRDSLQPERRSAQACTISSVRSRNFVDVDAHDCAGHHAEIRERGVAAADAGHARRRCGGTCRPRPPSASSIRDR